MNTLTIDLEDWFQGLTSTNPQIDKWPTLESRVVTATNQLLALLQEFRVQATFFILGYVADQHPGLIEKIATAGHELGIHGYYHKFVYKLTPSEFAQEIDMSLSAVQRITGVYPAGHRAPYFSINKHTTWAFDILQQHGLHYDSSVFPTRNMLYGYPTAPRFPYQHPNGLLEFPASTIRLAGRNWPMSGGFYLRALPYPFIRWAIKRLNAQNQPAILYLHPWELDTGQTYPHVTPRERLTHYHGRHSLLNKWRKLLTEFQFAPMHTLIDERQTTKDNPSVLRPPSSVLLPS